MQESEKMTSVEVDANTRDLLASAGVGIICKTPSVHDFFY